MAPSGKPGWIATSILTQGRMGSWVLSLLFSGFHRTDLQPVQQLQEHVQEDIVLEPRTMATCYVHHQAHCPLCDRNVLLPGPGALLGSNIGPAAKATEACLRHELNVPCRKISRFFADFFGLKFMPATAYGFEPQSVTAKSCRTRKPP